MGLASPIYHYAEVAKTCNENKTECSHRCNMNFVKYKNIPDALMEENYLPICQGRIEAFEGVPSEGVPGQPKNCEF